MPKRDYDPINVTIGVADETYGEPMDFHLYDDGVTFGADFTKTDLTVSHAILMDLADAIAKKLASMIH